MGRLLHCVLCQKRLRHSSIRPNIRLLATCALTAVQTEREWQWKVESKEQEISGLTNRLRQVQRGWDISEGSLWGGGAVCEWMVQGKEARGTPVVGLSLCCPTITGGAPSAPLTSLPDFP